MALEGKGLASPVTPALTIAAKHSPKMKALNIA
jgi:hypothetical protein